MSWLQDLPVLVLGLGDSGLAMARWCVRHGARVRVWDSRESVPNDAVLAEQLPRVQRLREIEQIADIVPASKVPASNIVGIAGLENGNWGSVLSGLNSERKRISAEIISGLRVNAPRPGSRDAAGA